MHQEEEEEEEEEEAGCLKRVVYTVLCILGFVVLSLDFQAAYCMQ
jgi:hypothetical protein